MHQVIDFFETFRSKNHFLLIMSMIYFLLSLARGAFFIYIPELLQSFVGSIALVGFIFSIPWIIDLFADFFIGYYTDRLNKKILILIAIALFIITVLLFYFLPSFTALIIAIIIYGIAADMYYIPSLSFILDKAPKKRGATYTGVYFSFEALGYSLGPIIGGVILASMFPERVFLFAAAVFVVCFLLTLFFVTDGLPKKSRKIISFKNEFKAFKKLEKSAFGVIFFTFVYGFWVSFIWMAMPLYVIFLNLDPIYKGLILSALIFPQFLTRGVWGVIEDSHGKLKTLGVGLTIGTVAMLFFSFSSTPFSLILSAIFIAIGFASIEPAIGGILTKVTDKENTGEAASLKCMTANFAAIIGPILGGFLITFLNFRLSFLILALIIFFGSLIALRFMKKLP
ncbi:MAG: MFS transporter [archaeon]